MGTGKKTVTVSYPMTSGRRNEFWVAQVRGANFDELHRRGFLTFFPAVDDYAFLPVSDKNRRLTDCEEELQIEFLRVSDCLQTVTRAELAGMSHAAGERLRAGSRIVVVRGACEGLSGKVVKILGDELLCEVEGYQRFYERTLLRTDVVPED